MEKSAVVAFRNSLTADNKTLRIVFDNGVNLSVASDMVVWDDENETMVGFVADGQSGSFSAGLPIRAICSTYENIQFMMANTNISDLSTMIDNLKSSVSTIDDTKKKQILDYFRKIYDYRTELKDEFYYHQPKM